MLRKNRSKFSTVALFLVLSLFSSCMEEIPLENIEFEEVLVIEGVITNELKFHNVKLSYVYPVDQSGPAIATGAAVQVLGDETIEYEEVEPGMYVSSEKFAASPGIEYTLEVEIDGEIFQSEPVTLTPERSIEELKAARIELNGEDGVAITLNSANTEGTGFFYRYEFEETYKFVSAFNKNRDLIIENGVIKAVPKTREEYTCFKTETSQDILLANTTSLSEDVINDFLINFIDAKNPKLAQRYSIFVKQFVINQEAFNYYETLQKISEIENVFTQTQPGFLAGNIFSVNEPEKKVIGYFSVSSVSTKRLFFNYEDFYGPENIRPTFISYCPVGNPTLDVLKQAIINGTVKWYGTLTPPVPHRPYKVVPANCVDCTRLGTNIVPEFWIE